MGPHNQVPSEFQLSALWFTLSLQQLSIAFRFSHSHSGARRCFHWCVSVCGSPSLLLSLALETAVCRMSSPVLWIQESWFSSLLAFYFLGLGGYFKLLNCGNGNQKSQRIAFEWKNLLISYSSWVSNTESLVSVF